MKSIIALTASVLVAALGISIISSWPSTYAFEFITSQVKGCAVRVENPVARTALGAAGTSAGGTGWWLAAGSKIFEMNVPATAATFHQECK